MNAAAATASILRPPMVLLMAMLKPITFFSRKAATAFLFIYIVTSSIHTWLCWPMHCTLLGYSAPHYTLYSAGLQRNPGNLSGTCRSQLCIAVGDSRTHILHFYFVLCVSCFVHCVSSFIHCV